jgi:uncharacterized protein YkwD
MRCTLLILLVAVGCSSTTVKPPVTSPVPTSKSPQEAVVYLVNKERERARLSALGTLRTLDKAAQDYSQQMESAGQLSHNLGGGFQQRVNSWNVMYTAAGENIAEGYSTPELVVAGWMNSPGHRANILNRGYNVTGVGVSATRGQRWWCQEFAQQLSGSQQLPSVKPEFNLPGPLRRERDAGAGGDREDTEGVAVGCRRIGQVWRAACVGGPRDHGSLGRDRLGWRGQ